MTRKYNAVSNADRRALISLVSAGFTIKAAAERLGINYDNGRAIHSTFKRYNRLSKVPYKARTVTRQKNYKDKALNDEPVTCDNQTSAGLSCCHEPSNDNAPAQEATSMIVEAFPAGLFSAQPSPNYLLSNDDSLCVTKYGSVHTIEESLSVPPALNYNIGTFFLEDFDDTLSIG